MAGPERLGDVAIVLGPLVGVVDVQRDGRAGGAAFEDARQDAHGILLAPLGHEFRLAGLAPVEPGLDVGFRQAMPGGQPSTTQPIAGP